MKTISAILAVLCVSMSWAGAQTIASPSTTANASTGQTVPKDTPPKPWAATVAPGGLITAPLMP